MKKRWLLALPLTVLLMAPHMYNPSDFPGTYTNGGTASASGVITASPGLLVDCDLYNGNAAARTFQFYDSATVPSDGAQGCDSSHFSGCWKVSVTCPATTQCAWSIVGQAPLRAAAVPFANGISWANSSTVQTKTVGSADSTVSCRYYN